MKIFGAVSWKFFNLNLIFFLYRDDDRDCDYDMAEYKNRAYDDRIRRGRVYDAQFDRFRRHGSDEFETKIKNCLHLYLLQTPAGERASSLNEVSN